MSLRRSPPRVQFSENISWGGHFHLGALKNTKKNKNGANLNVDNTESLFYLLICWALISKLSDEEQVRAESVIFEDVYGTLWGPSPPPVVVKIECLHTVTFNWSHLHVTVTVQPSVLHYGQLFEILCWTVQCSWVRAAICWSHVRWTFSLGWTTALSSDHPFLCHCTSHTQCSNVPGPI